jgi:hypothetical protein
MKCLYCRQSLNRSIEGDVPLRMVAPQISINDVTDCRHESMVGAPDVIEARRMIVEQRWLLHRRPQADSLCSGSGAS